MENRQPASTHEEACERVASLFASRWLRYYTVSKLRSDPVFAAAYEIFRSSKEPILDVGCGVGLLAFYLRERGLGQPITGLDADARKIRKACEVARNRYRDLEFIERDVRAPIPGFRGTVAVLDLVHYLEPARQGTLLEEVASFVSPGGVLVLRDCPRDKSIRYWLTHAGEIFAQAISWNLRTALHFPTHASIYAAFPTEEFTSSETPSWGSTPFNNRLFVFRRKL